MRFNRIGGSLTAVICFMLFTANTLCAQKQYHIKGTIKGVPSGTVRLVANNEDDRTQKTVDSGIITNGSFELRGKLATPQMMTIKLEPGNWSFNVFIENTAIAITADTTGAQHYDYTADGMGKGANIVKFTETGSKNYDDWMVYQNDPGQKQYDPVQAELDKKLTAAGKDVDAEYRVRDQMDSVSNLLFAWQKKKIDEYVKQNPSSVAGVYIFYEYYQWVSGSMPYAVLDEMLNKYTGEAKQSDYYKSLAISRTKLKAVQPGSIAPDFTLLQRDSTKLTLSSTRGKYIMIDFWASWCHPCRQAIPHWKTLYQKYHDKGFDILSVSNDFRWKDWTKAMDEEEMPWRQVDDEFPVKYKPAKVAAGLYMTTFIPFYVLLDKEGKILVYTGDKTKIDAKLEELFGE
jgi:thiol-disulfide isomerase/thioredoxin